MILDNLQTGGIFKFMHKLFEIKVNFIPEMTPVIRTWLYKASPQELIWALTQNGNTWKEAKPRTTHANWGTWSSHLWEVGGQRWEGHDFWVCLVLWFWFLDHINILCIWKKIIFQTKKADPKINNNQKQMNLTVLSNFVWLCYFLLL